MIEQLDSGFAIESAFEAEAERGRQRDEVGQQDFLRMLVAQLENQDPLNPQDSTEFTAQLATFSSLEQQISIRAGIEELVAAQEKSGQLDDALRLAGMIGKDVTALGEQLEIPTGGLQAGEEVDLPFSLGSAATQGAIEIRTASGALVRSIDLSGSQLGAGDQLATWDGRDQFGTALAPGIYRFQVNATSGNQPVASTSMMTGRVTASTIGQGTPVLLLGSRVLPFEDIVEIREPKP